MGMKEEAGERMRWDGMRGRQAGSSRRENVSASECITCFSQPFLFAVGGGEELNASWIARGGAGREG
jgi:hypothetical protein